MIYLLVGYMWLFIHRPFEVWPWLGALHVERIYMILTILYWAVAVPKTWLACRNNVPVLLLAVTLFVASQTSPYATFDYVADWFKIFVFYVLVVTTIRSEREVKVLVVMFVAVMALYMAHSLREYLCGAHVYRMGVARMVGVGVTSSDPNAFGASVDAALPFLYPVWTLAAKSWQKLAVIGIFALGALCILGTGSRSSFVGLAVLGLASVLASRYRWSLLLAMVVAAPFIWLNMRPDLQDRYLTLIDPSYGPANAAVSADGRTQSFWYGMQSFADNPLSGAGLGSFRAINGYATHNLYNEAMGELGLPGLLVLVGFAWAFLANLLEARRIVKDRSDSDTLFLYRVCVAAAGTCALLFLLGYSGHNLMRYNWLWCGAFSGTSVHFLREVARERMHACPETDPAEPCEPVLADAYGASTIQASLSSPVQHPGAK